MDKWRKHSPRLLLYWLALTLLGLGSQPVRAATSVLEDALSEPLAYYGLTDDPGEYCDRGYCWSPERRGTAMLYLTVAAIAGNGQAAPRLLEHVRNLLIPGHEPDCTGSLSSRGHAAVVAAFALMRKYPSLWRQLLPYERLKIRSLVKGCLAACAVTSSDQGDFSSGLDGAGNFSKTWNPNYREAFMGELIAAALFFGPERADGMLQRFDCASYIEEARLMGLPTLATLFEDQGAPDISCSEIDRVVRNYHYQGHPLSDLIGIQQAVGQYTFSEIVVCSVTRDGQSGGLVAGCDGLPNQGQSGMLREFNANDSYGLRSSLSYSAHGWSNHTVTTLLMEYFGLIAEQSLQDARQIGTIDLFYKAEHGYLSFAQGESKYEDDSSLTFGFKYLRGFGETLFLDGK